MDRLYNTVLQRCTAAFHFKHPDKVAEAFYQFKAVLPIHIRVLNTMRAVGCINLPPLHYALRLVIMVN
jgi:hypothetical protein